MGSLRALAGKVRGAIRTVAMIEQTRSNVADDALFYYITEAELSKDDGPGVNEWGFVSKLTAVLPDKVVCFAPSPSQSGGRRCPGVRYVIGHRGLHPFFFLVFQLDLLRALVEMAQQRRPTAIVVRPGIFPLMPLIVARWLDVPLFVKTLGMGALTTLPKRYFPLGRYLLYPVTSWAYRRLLQRAQLIDTVSKTYINWAMETFGLPRERLVLIPNGVDEEMFSPCPRDEAREKLGLNGLSRVVGFVGTLTWYCGVERLIEASLTILERYPDTTFLVVGDGRERPGLETMAEERGVRDSFLFVGRVPYEKVPDYINASDVSAILWPSVRMQKVGSSAVKLRQYLACGCPVVASRGDGHEFIEENGLGWLVVPEDPEQVAEAICTGLGLTSEEKENIGERAREYAVANFSMESLVRRRYELWLEAVRDA